MKNDYKEKIDDYGYKLRSVLTSNFMSKFFLVVIITFFIFLTFSINFASANTFVEVENGEFSLDGTPFRVAGTNAYYLPTYQKIDEDFIDETLDAFEQANITVIRMWAFYDGYDCGYSKQDPSENVIQTSPGQYDEQALINLDIVIAKGKERNIKFILPLINFWDELGGICQYNTWAGSNNPSNNMEFFLNNQQTQQWYKNYMSMLLNRVNTQTGIAYKDEPAIFAWQIMNEARNPGKDPKELRDWYREIAIHIKSIDSNHLVSTGEEGFDDASLGDWTDQGKFMHPSYSSNEYSNTYILRSGEGTSFVLNTQIPEIDFGNFHWYPSEFGFGVQVNEDILNAQSAWLSDHKKIAEQFNKPVILGEYGFPGWGDERTKTIYENLWDHSEKESKLDGTFIWQLTIDYTKCSEYGGNICWPKGRQDKSLYEGFLNHINNMGVLPQSNREDTSENEDDQSNNNFNDDNYDDDDFVYQTSSTNYKNTQRLLQETSPNIMQTQDEPSQDQKNTIDIIQQDNTKLQVATSNSKQNKSIFNITHVLVFLIITLVIINILILKKVRF